MTRRPTVDAAWAATSAELRAALNADPLIYEALRAADGAESGPTRDQHLADAAARIAPLAPSLPESEWRSQMGAMISGGEVRATVVPGIVGRVVWAIRDGTDVDALRAYIEPGQVWVRADLVTADRWPLVRAQAMDAMERTIGKVRRPGRHKGSRNVARLTLISAVRGDPAMTDAAISTQGAELKVWDEAGRDDDKVVRERARRIRADADVKP